jgi:hypothetical protein
MPSNFSIGARARLGILAIVTALCVVPPLVRATYTATGASTLRLNRGFSLPPSKSRVARPDDVAAIVAPADERQISDRVAPRVRPADDSVPIAPPDRSRDPLRGPPRARLV